MTDILTWKILDLGFTLINFLELNSVLRDGLGLFLSTVKVNVTTQNKEWTKEKKRGNLRKREDGDSNTQRFSQVFLLPQSSLISAEYMHGLPRRNVDFYFSRSPSITNPALSLLLHILCGNLIKLSMKVA